jgi:hypothetical protein
VLVAKKGVLVANFLRHDKRVYFRLYRTIKRLFPNVFRVPLNHYGSKNALLIATKDARRRPQRALTERRLAKIERRLAVKLELMRCAQQVNRDFTVERGPIYRDPK